MSNWSLLTVRVGDHDVAAVRLDDGRIVVPDILRIYPGLRSALDDWAVLEPLLRDLDPVGLPELTGSAATATVRYPNKLLGMGPNYYDHMAEMGSPPAPDDAQPFFYCVPPTTTMIGSGQSILIPADAAILPDWEAELGVIIGRGGREINESSALDHVAGYACFNDISARALMRRAKPLAEPFTWDWTACKGLDTFCPMGPMTPAWMVPDPQAMSIRCLINGVVKQDSSTAAMIASVAAVIAAASQFWSLEPGDVISTGTPAGVGHARHEYLADGDEVRVEIGDLVPLVNLVRTRTSSDALVGS